MERVKLMGAHKGRPITTVVLFGLIRNSMPSLLQMASLSYLKRCTSESCSISYRRPLNVVGRWRKHVTLSVNPGKTDVMLFTRKYKVEALRGPNLEGKQLNFSDFAGR